MMETHYQRIGGEAAIRRVVDRFYDLMDQEAEYAGIRQMHPADLADSRDKLFMFLSGWMGGPPLFVEKHGPPMLRRRHLPFAIGANERDQWMSCMMRAMADCELEERLRQELTQALWKTADFMRNQDA